MIRRVGIAAAAAAMALLATGSVAHAEFGIVPNSLKTAALNRDGSVDVQAGSHPYAYSISFEFNHDSEGNAEGSARDIVVQLPPGLVGNAAKMPQCPREDLAGLTASCPGDTQIGTFSIVFQEPSGGLAPAGAVYNLVPPKGSAASFGFTAAGFNAIENASLVNSGAGYRVAVSTTNISREHAVTIDEKVWGIPADRGHDPERECTVEGVLTRGCSTDVAPTPFLSLPTECGLPLATVVEADSVEAPEEKSVALAESLDAGGNPIGLFGCESLDFKPSILVQPETHAAATATGLGVDVSIPQSESVGGLAEADLKRATVVLPAGMVVNPSSANGLSSCSSAQISLSTSAAPTCPDASKIGEIEVDTPLLDHPLPGTVYLAAQGDNPFGSLLAIYVVVDDAQTGTVVKLAGHIEADPATGQLTTRFSENPQLPFEDFKINLTGGQRAPLLTPEVCGEATTTSDMVPWTSPQGQDANPTSTFHVSSGPGGSACASTQAEEPNGPGLEAGTTVPLAASYSPFVLKVAREQGSQPIARIEATLPPGLTGKLAGVARCSETQIAAAQAPGRIGGEERMNPSCPSASEIGVSDVGAGAGTSADQVHVAGRIYLAGPYAGAPFSIVDITPAVAGPFDLGVVVVRSALYVNPQTAQVTVRSDPIPTILQGIPVDARDIVVNINRTQFTLNPTSCEHMAVTGNATSVLGQSAPLSNPFQVGGCAGLAFKPAFSVSTQGKTSKLNGASLTVKVSEKLGEANIHKVDLQLPAALPSRLTTLQKACLAAQFVANPAGCPAGAVIGTATAITPILNVPLTGPAYLVSHGGAKFPDVVFLLQGEGVKVELTGNTDIKKGITYSRFETVPDAPISSFEAKLPEGPHSALSAFGDLCTKNLVLPTKLVGQNGAQLTQNTKIAVTGCPKPTLKLGHTRITSTSALITLRTSQPVALTITGNGVKTTRRTLGRGTHLVGLALTNIGKAAHAHHRRIVLHVTMHGSSSTVRRALALKL